MERETGVKMVKQKGRVGQKRKSTRILALETLKKAKKQSNNNNPSTSTQQQQSQRVTATKNNATPPPPPDMQASSSRQPLAQARRGRKKKRLDEVAVTSVGPTTRQNGEKPKHEVPPVNNVFPCAQHMPEKHILEFILDVLQRRDTHEIFAQPVDPNEVEGYDSIIEKPMDFGTMRAKLQEGMYTSWEQFENDVFLISSNAMLFNSSATIYFRQARAIHELAKRVFHTLKTDPKQIELESSLTIKQHGRKLQGETRGTRVKLGAKLRGNSLAYRGSSGANPHHSEILPGFRNGRNGNFCETERHQMYKPQTSIVSEKEQIVATVYGSSKQLVTGNGGIGYKESLLRFVKDLGPTAQTVVNQKLRCLTQTSLISSSSAQQRSNCMDGVINGITMDANIPLGSHGATSKGKGILTSDSSACRGRMALGIGGLDIHCAASKGKSVLTGDSMDPYGGACGGKTALDGRVDFQGASHKETLPHSGIMGSHSALQGEMAHDTMARITDPSFRYMDLLQGAVRGNIAHHIQNTQNCNRKAGTRPLGDQVQPGHLASRSQSGLLELLSRGNRRPKSSVYPSKVIKASGSSQASTLLHGLGKESNAPLDLNCGISSAQVGQPLEWSQPTPWGPQAIYDFPQIQPQLGEVNPLGKGGFMQQEPQPSEMNPLGQEVFARQQSPVVSVPYMQLQPSGVNPLDQDAALQQELELALAQNMQYQHPNEANIFSQDGFAQQGLQFATTPYSQPSLMNLLGQDAFVQPELQLPVVSYVQPQTNEVNPLGQGAYGQHEPQLGLSQNIEPQHSDVNPLGQEDMILPRETQLGLQQRGLMADAGNFGEGAHLQGHQPNTNAQFWNLLQQSLRGIQHPDLALRLQMQNRR